MSEILRRSEILIVLEPRSVTVDIKDSDHRTICDIGAELIDKKTGQWVVFSSTHDNDFLNLVASSKKWILRRLVDMALDLASEDE